MSDLRCPQCDGKLELIRFEGPQAVFVCLRCGEKVKLCQD
jgi:DNA-directed RNA polymerase subunit RPC12/RpoP